MSVKKINSITVSEIPKLAGEKEDTRLAKGYKLFPIAYSIISILAHKNSGKTTVIYNIIKHCATQKTKIVVFCSTIYNDDNWKRIRQHCEDSGIDIIAFTSMIENGVNQLNIIVETLKEEQKQKEDEQKEKENEKDLDEQISVKKQGTIKMKTLKDEEDEENEEKKEKKPRKDKYITPEYLFIFDDLSKELKSPDIEYLLKRNRHFKCKVIISSQYVLDLPPSSRKQIEYWLFFRGNGEDKLFKIFQDMDLNITFPQFMQLYGKCTSEKYSFLYVDKNKRQFRKNFNEIIKIGKKDNPDIEEDDGDDIEDI